MAPKEKRFLGIYGQYLPRLHLFQIAMVILGYYSSMGVMMTLASLVGLTHAHLGSIFHFRSRDFSTSTGQWSIAASSIALIPFAFTMAVFVEKKGRVLDFIITVYAVHILLSAVYSREWPSLPWLACILIQSTLACLLSEYLCGRVEQSELSSISHIIDSNEARPLTAPPSRSPRRNTRSDNTDNI